VYFQVSCPFLTFLVTKGSVTIFFGHTTFGHTISKSTFSKKIQRAFWKWNLNICNCV